MAGRALDLLVDKGLRQLPPGVGHCRAIGPTKAQILFRLNRLQSEAIGRSGEGGLAGIANGAGAIHHGLQGGRAAIEHHQLTSSDARADLPATERFQPQLCATAASRELQLQAVVLRLLGQPAHAVDGGQLHKCGGTLGAVADTDEGIALFYKTSCATLIDSDPDFAACPKRLPLSFTAGQTVDLFQRWRLPEVGKPAASNAHRAAQTDLDHPGRLVQREISHRAAMEMPPAGAAAIAGPRVNHR